MADTGRRVAIQAFAVSGQVISKNEVRTSSDPVVTANPQWFATIDNADPDIPKGKYGWLRIRGGN